MIERGDQKLLGPFQKIDILEGIPRKFEFLPFFYVMYCYLLCIDIKENKELTEISRLIVK